MAYGSRYQRGHGHVGMRDYVKLNTERRGTFFKNL